MIGVRENCVSDCCEKMTDDDAIDDGYNESKIDAIITSFGTFLVGRGLLIVRISKTCIKK